MMRVIHPIAHHDRHTPTPRIVLHGHLSIQEPCLYTEDEGEHEVIHFVGVVMRGVKSSTTSSSPSGIVQRHELLFVMMRA